MVLRTDQGATREFRRPRERTFWLSLALLLAVFSIVCLRGIAAPWHWGHNGYNGAAFSQAAKNSLRFGIVGQAPYYFGDEPPPAHEIYTHHPLALHGHVIASFLVFGEREWAARLVPAAYSVASLLLLVLVVRRYWDDGTALLTGAFFALMPLNLVYANMVDHEQGGIFWSLASLFGYLRWLDTGARRFAWFSLVAITVATQFDWPGYYVAFATAAHCVVLGLRGAAPGSWKWFVLVFSAVTSLNMLAFFTWIYIARSGLDDMVSSFMLRSTAPPIDAYAALIWGRVRTLIGPPLLIAAAAGAVAALLDCRRSGARPRAILPIAFAFAGIVHVVAFPHAAERHAYWIYYWGPTAALLAAIGVLRATAWLARGQAETGWAAACVAGFAAIVGMNAWHTTVQALDHGHGADCIDCDFQHSERAWFVALKERPLEGPTTFYIHSSVREPRIELLYYLDAPYRLVTNLRPRGDGILLVDAGRLGETERALAHGYRSMRSVSSWDDRFLTIDFRDARPRLDRFASVTDALPLWRRWLMTQTSLPPRRWERAP